MASSSTAAGGGNMKGYFRQRKKTGGITKSNSNSKSKKSSSPDHSATLASDIAKPSSLISHASLDLQDDYDGNEEVLRQFDMNMAYGPCLGMSRLDRWDRANALGLNPPKDVERLLRVGKLHSECLWDGRV
ncbi:unnamed protein product [Ilex paraguariensis]|uniref:DNA polymerase delta subunit 4 n=1 Tax=Ilex paraguariensis TaxID=185542 RepID=A0ABC8TR54_9AQUA